MALASVYESYKMRNEDNNYQLKSDTLTEKENINPHITSHVCLNCERKLKSTNLYCDKDCETTHLLIQELEEEIHNLKQKDILSQGANYTADIKKHNLEILEKELSLLKYKKDIGLVDEQNYLNEKLLLKHPNLALELTNTIDEFGNHSTPIPIPIRYRKGGKKQKTKKIKKTKRKWSQKYKKSINCKRPKGFSQKQYCKYGRKK
jgi:hypothetical protein